MLQRSLLLGAKHLLSTRIISPYMQMIPLAVVIDHFSEKSCIHISKQEVDSVVNCNSNPIVALQKNLQHSP